VLVVITKKKLKLPQKLYEILQLVSLSAFERTPLKNLFLNENIQDVKEQNCNQLILLEL